jgi:hypothetical protein
MKNVSVTVSIYNTEVDIDPVEVLEQLDSADIVDYLDDKQFPFRSVDLDYGTIVESYYKGNFDLKKLLHELKMDDLVAIVEAKKFCQPWKTQV